MITDLLLSIFSWGAIALILHCHRGSSRLEGRSNG